MGLYPAQQQVVDQLNHFYQFKNAITQNHYYLSGEMGVGKTYMGAQIALDHAQNGVIIVVPDVVSNKWVTVLNELKTDQVITLMSNHAIKTQPMISFQPGHITVIPNQLFNRLFNRDQKDPKRQTQNYVLTVLDNYADADLKTIEDQIKQLDPDQQKSYNFLQFRLRHSFLVYDEIHQARQSKLQCLDDLLNTNINNLRPKLFKLDHFDQLTTKYITNKTKQDSFPALFLTGTIFNTDQTILQNLLMTTNPQLIKYNQVVHSYELDDFPTSIASFLDQLWQYISVSIALKSVQLHNDDQINQTIQPIQAIPLTDEEKAFYELIRAQLQANFPTNSHYQIQKQNLIASKFLDFPQATPEIAIKKPKRKDLMFGFKQSVLLSAPLNPIPLKATKKYQRLVQEIDQIPTDQKIVIYVQDQTLIDQMTKQLQVDGYTVDRLNHHIKANQYSQYINDSLNTHHIFIINPKDITVGVDIDAQVLIWYQLLPDMTEIIQAQRRIYRMNSDRDSTVIFLPYALTYQESLVDAISNAAKNNAATYGVQDRSELAKKTHVLLAAIQQK